MTSLHSRLIRIARRNPPDDRVPAGFERRVMARIRSAAESAESSWVLWTRWIWRAALSGVAIAVLLVGVDGSLPEVPETADEVAESGSTSPLEVTLLASAGPDGDAW